MAETYRRLAFPPLVPRDLRRQPGVVTTDTSPADDATRARAATSTGATDPTSTRAPLDGPRLVRKLLPAQTFLVLGSSVDLTLTGIVGVHLAPTRALATLPFSLIPVATMATTFAASRLIGRVGYRRTFVLAPLAAVAAGVLSAAGVQWHAFWLFCVGTALVGVYGAGAAYYGYAAAEANPETRARAVTTLLAGGLVAALAGPFLATAVKDLTGTPYVASYLMVAAFGVGATAWNARLPRALDGLAVPSRAAQGTGRPPRVIWRQPPLLLGVAARVLAGVSMTAMMTAGPIAGMAMGHSEGAAAFSVQLHMVGMFAPGLLVARWIGRVGERAVALLGAGVLVVAGWAATMGSPTWAFLLAMTAVGVGWNLASSGGSAMVVGSYAPAERGRVQPFVELAATVCQVVGSLSAGVLATVHGWSRLGAGVVVLAVLVGGALARAGRRSPA
jgi:MFS family permease